MGVAGAVPPDLTSGQAPEGSGGVHQPLWFLLTAVVLPAHTKGRSCILKVILSARYSKKTEQSLGTPFAVVLLFDLRAGRCSEQLICPR